MTKYEEIASRYHQNYINTLQGRVESSISKIVLPYIDSPELITELTTETLNWIHFCEEN